MTNTEIVEKIKRVLEDPEGVANDELEELASVFARRLRSVDEGLGRARSALQSGQLCEADRQLRDEQLIEASEILMFDQFEDWQSACRILGLETPVAISKGAGADLLEFSYRFEPVRETFAKYRLLELEGGSPRSRLELLYEIKAALPKYVDFFSRSLIRLEGEFDKGVASKLKLTEPDGVPQRDLLRWRACLTRPERETPSDSGLVRKIDARLELFQSNEALKKLDSLVQRWESATTDAERFACNAEYFNGEEEFIKALTMAPKSTLDRLNRLVATAQSAERTLNADRTYQAKLKRLQGYVARSENVDELESVYQEAELAAQAANAQIPHSVQEDYETRVESILARKRRKRTSIIALTLALVVFFAFLIVSITTRGRMEKRAQASAAEITRRLDEFKAVRENSENYPSLAAAKEIVERNATESPEYMEVEDYKIAVEQYEIAARTEAKRQKEFENALAVVEREHEDGRAVPNLVANLKRQVLTDEERQQFNAAYKEDADLSKTKSQSRIDAYKAELETLVADYRALESSETTTNAERLAEIRRIRDRVHSLAGNEKFGVSKELVDRRETLQKAVEGFERRAQTDASTAEMGRELLETVGNAEAYVGALNELKKKLKNDDRLLAAIESANQDVANVRRAASWNALIGKFPTALEWCADPTAFKELDASLTKDRAALSFAPDYESAKTIVAKTRSFVEGGGFENARKPLLKDLREFERPLWVLFDDERHNYYYVTSDPAETNELKYIPHAGGVLQNFNVDEFRGELESHKAPQNEFAQIVSSNLSSNPTPDSWFEAVSAILRTLDAESEETLDPALKYRLLGLAAESVARFPELDELAKWFEDSKKLEDANPNANVYTPGAQLQSARVGALAALRRAPNLSELDARAKEFWRTLKAPLGTSYDWIGYLDFNDGEPVVRAKASLDNYGDLWVAIGTTGAATRCGEVRDGRATITDEKDLSVANRWTPIYASRAAQE